MDKLNLQTDKQEKTKQEDIKQKEVSMEDIEREVLDLFKRRKWERISDEKKLALFLEFKHESLKLNESLKGLNLGIQEIDTMAINKNSFFLEEKEDDKKIKNINSFQIAIYFKNIPNVICLEFEKDDFKYTLLDDQSPVYKQINEWVRLILIKVWDCEPFPYNKARSEMEKIYENLHRIGRGENVQDV